MRFLKSLSGIKYQCGDSAGIQPGELHLIHGTIPAELSFSEFDGCSGKQTGKSLLLHSCINQAVPAKPFSSCHHD